MSNKDEYIVYYEIVYSIDKERMQKFITMNIEEIKIKTSEVLGDGTKCVHFRFNRLMGTRGLFVSELRKCVELSC